MNMYILTATALVALAATVLAAPSHPHTHHRQSSLADLQCTCLRLSSSPPTPCTSPSLPRTPLTWHAAQSLATEFDLPVHFATRATIERILAIPSPLPTSVLQTAGRGVAVPLVGEGRDELVCGFGSVGLGTVRDETEEVERREDGFVASVLGWLMVFVAVYLVGEWAWVRIKGRGRRVRLCGGEKRLRV